MRIDSQNHGQLDEEVGAGDCAIEQLAHQLVENLIFLRWAKYLHIVCPIHNRADGYVEEVEQKGGDQLPPRSDVLGKLERDGFSMV